jgi:xylan 1,4-beta-xylosidase
MTLSSFLLTLSLVGLSFFTPKKDPILLADPTVFYHNGIYYLYGTSGKDSNLGFEVYTSRDLKSWKKSDKNGGYALWKGDSYGEIGFWAPQVFEYEGKFYMAYTANEHIAIATADNPLGPFTQDEIKDLRAPVKQIDPYVFIDSDGKKYLYHVRLTEGNRLFVAELEDDFSGIKEETLTYCFHAEEHWENTQGVNWSVSEGPAIIKHKDLYYFIYSANDFRNPDYAVGYAVSESPMGPWTKSPSNPIFDKSDAGINGPGHGDYFVDGRGNLKYVLHTHQSDQSVSPRKTAVVDLEFKTAKDGIDVLDVKKGSLRFLDVD